jgi:branched-chain amino acid transport system substrate-binding protein
LAWRRRALLAALLSLCAVPVPAQQNPVRIGSTLALTGPLSATAQIHKLVGEIYVEQLNKRGGLLGRPVEWIVKDDQSKPDVARTLYEQLITADKVDLLMGPYATGAILSAMGVAQRYDKLLIHHTFGIPSLAKYDKQFPAWSLGPDPGSTVPNTVFSALAAVGKTPKTIAVVTSKFPSLHFISLGAREVAKKRGIDEVLFLEWEFGNRDFGPIAARIKDAKPDFVWVGAIGLDGNLLIDAMKKLDYTPPLHFYVYPAPGPMVQSADANGALSVSIFEDHPPLNTPAGGRRVHEDLPRARRQGQPARDQRRGAGRRVVHRLADAGGRGQRHQEPRRQGAGRVAQVEQGRHHPGQAALRRPQQLRRRPDARQAGAERPLADRLPARGGGARRQAGRQVTAPTVRDAALTPPVRR